MQFQSDIMNVNVERPRIMETTALGAAYLAGIHVKFWKNKEEIIEHKQDDFVYYPRMEETERKELIRGWKIAVHSTRSFKL